MAGRVPERDWPDVPDSRLREVWTPAVVWYVSGLHSTEGKHGRRARLRDQTVISQSGCRTAVRRPGETPPLWRWIQNDAVKRMCLG